MISQVRGLLVRVGRVLIWIVGRRHCDLDMLRGSHAAPNLQSFDHARLMGRQTGRI